MAWTDEQVESLRQLWAEGLTANEIAKKLGVTKNSIVGKVHRLCLPARPSPIKIKEDGEMLEFPETELAEQVSDEAVFEAEDVNQGEVKKACKPGENIQLVDLDSHTCRWPIGDPRDEDFCFCGKKVRTGQTYCDEHAQMAYVKAIKKQGSF